MNIDIDKMVRGYLITALWSSNDGDKNLDDDYSIEDISQEVWDQAEKDCKSFIEQAKSIEDNDSPSNIGHNFWLTRNGHGAGFWDGDYPIDGERLTNICKGFKEVDLYVGDDNQIYS